MTFFFTKSQPHPQTTAGNNNAGWVKESNIQQFVPDVVEASMNVLVLVDFWAPWCGPCKQLTPILERVVHQQQGKVLLVKINIDENPAIAQQMGIQSIPAVFAFKDGQPVDGFMGMLPEPQVKVFIERLLKHFSSPSGVDDILVMANDAYIQGQPAQAQHLYMKILQQDPKHLNALVGVTRCMIAQGHVQKTQEWIREIEQQIQLQQESITGDLQDLFRSVAALQDAGWGEIDQDILMLQSKNKQDPADLDTQHRLAVALFQDGRHHDAIQELMGIIRKNRHWNDDQARKTLVHLFIILGHNHPLTQDGRRQLSSIMFS